MANEIDSRQVLERLAREGSGGVGEVSAVACPGARAAAWAIKVKSLSSYNVYNVIAVTIGAAGSVPLEIGQETEAVNLAEPFDSAGTLSAGTFAVMSRVGERYVFYAVP
ncbi:MAG: hypothetical protein ACYS8Z_02425 [Planctomycetota bacterium]|jgi:hypothetical protein